MSDERTEDEWEIWGCADSVAMFPAVSRERHLSLHPGQKELMHSFKARSVLEAFAFHDALLYGKPYNPDMSTLDWRGVMDIQIGYHRGMLAREVNP